MRIACFQGPENSGRAEANLALLARAAAAARSKGADLLIACEMFLTGYAIGAAAARESAEPPDGPSAKAAARIAADNRIGIVYGFPELADDGSVYNSSMAIGPTGERLATYRKSHLFGEVDRSQFSPGAEEPAIFEIGGIRAGMLICYDVEFPENVRALALRGAQLVLVPTALMRPYEVVAQSVIPARSFENQIFVAYANRCGKEAEFHYCGLSCVTGPDGMVRARAGESEELVIADIDLADIARAHGYNNYLGDRRPELYERLGQGTEFHGS